MMYSKLILERIKEFLVFHNTRQKKISRNSFFSEVLHQVDYQPVFFLSTGRAGTTLMTNILETSNNTHVIHDHQQDLLFVSKLSYESFACLNHKEDVKELSKQCAASYLAAREHDLYTSYLHGKTLIETNNRITFLAPGIAELIPNAKFVFLHRDPVKFVRSGMRRGYYQKETYTSAGRISPIKGQHKQNWDSYIAEEKIAWLWKETNQFIIDFLETIKDDNKMVYRFPFQNTDSVTKLMNFCGIDTISNNKLESLLNKKVNQQVTGSYPDFKEWKPEVQNKVLRITDEIEGLQGTK